jgi:cation-transporting ATPase E
MLLEILVIGIPSFCLALQPNNEKIKGKFIINLLSKSIPGAILLFLNIVACYLFDKAFGTDGQFITMASLAITFVGLLILFRLCKPFDVFRGIMFAAMIVICVLLLTFDTYSFFGYVPLSIQNVLFIVCIVEASYPVYDWIVKGLDKMFSFRKE